LTTEEVVIFLGANVCVSMCAHEKLNQHDDLVIIFIVGCDS